MAKQRVRLLVIEDVKCEIAELLSSIESDALSLECCDSTIAAVRSPGSSQFDAWILNSSSEAALRLIKESHQTNSDLPIIVVSPSTDEGFEALRRGATDCLLREEVTATALAQSVSNAVERAKDRASEKRRAQRYVALVENTDEIIYSHDLAGNYTSINKAGELLTGYSRQEALNLNSSQVIAPEYRELVNWMTNEKLAGNSSSCYEVEIITKHGRRLPLEVSTHLIYRDGEPVGVQGVARDITERKRREANLIESEQRYRQLVNEATDIIYRTDLTGHFTFVNPIASKAMRRPREELIGLHFLELLREDYRSKAADFYRQQVKEGIPATYFEFPTITGDGSEVWIGQNVQLLTRNSEPLELQAVARDITERKRAEQELRLSEERFSKAFNFMPLSMSLVSLEDLRILDVNRCFLELNGYERSEVIDRTASGLNLWGDAIAEKRFLETLKLKDSVRDEEIQVVKRDGNVRNYLISAEVINLHGQECILSVTIDITEHRALEEQLRQSQKMESLGQLAGGIAHDFNNMLTAITGYSEISLRRLGVHHPVSKNIEQIQKAGTRAASLTRQLLAFSRSQMLQPQVLDLNALVSDMDKMLKRLISEDIDLVTVLKADLVAIKADRGQIEQVLLNLAVNARDAMPNGGVITIETGDAQLDQSYARTHVSMPPGSYVLLAVSDTGLGMDVATQKRIFEPFFTTKELGKGTGLGLSTVYGIVKQSGGYIWVYSELEKGTTFKVYFPAVSETDGIESGVVGQRELPRGHEKVLIVEDDDQLRHLTQQILEENGYQVMSAANGAEALRLLQNCETGFDLVITDVVMPLMSGTELAEQIALLEPPPKVLYMSGYTDDSIVRHGVLQHKAFFLQKPFTAVSLAEKVREVLDDNETRT